MNQTKFYFPLIFISLEDEPWEPIEPNPNAAPAEEPVAAEPGLSESDWTLASTETVTHDYLTQNGKVARETIRQDVGGTVLSTKTLDFFYDDSGRPFAFNYSVDGSDFETYTISSTCKVTWSRSLTQMASCKQSTSIPRGAR